MSGFGERFRIRGYEIPKPLIEVGGKPIISHVVDLFPGDHDFIFVCNQEHLENTSWKMREKLCSLAESVAIVAIPPHKLGPVHAILSARDFLDLSAETVVNYADFSCIWDFQLFESDIKSRGLDGSVPAYRGFHPHSAGSTNYAYIREEGLLLREIREKMPFTSNKVAEFASSGTYYFRSGGQMLELFEEQVAKQISVGGEFYVSSAMGLLADQGFRVGVFELQHFMQWGTPEDLWDYEYWDRIFSNLVAYNKGSLEILGVGAGIILASGEGRRFRDRGYETPKALLPLSGDYLVMQVAKAAGQPAGLAISVLSDEVREAVICSGFGKVLSLSEVSQGQADTASKLVEFLGEELTGPFTVFPNDALFCDDTGLLQDMVSQHSDFIVVWVAAPPPFALANPDQFGWISQSEGRVFSDVKRSPRVQDSKVMTGAFSFSSPSIFRSLMGWVLDRNVTVGGELYIDSFVEAALDLGIKVLLFEPGLAVPLGTPHDYECFTYWQACFHKWNTHKYSLNNDPFVSTENLTTLLGNLEIEVTASKLDN